MRDFVECPTCYQMVYMKNGIFNSREPIVTEWCDNCDTKLKYNFLKSELLEADTHE